MKGMPWQKADAAVKPRRGKRGARSVNDHGVIDGMQRMSGMTGMLHAPLARAHYYNHTARCPECRRPVA